MNEHELQNIFIKALKERKIMNLNIDINQDSPSRIQRAWYDFILEDSIDALFLEYKKSIKKIQTRKQFFALLTDLQFTFLESKLKISKGVYINYIFVIDYVDFREVVFIYNEKLYITDNVFGLLEGFFIDRIITDITRELK